MDQQLPNLRRRRWGLLAAVIVAGALLIAFVASVAWVEYVQLTSTGGPFAATGSAAPPPVQDPTPAPPQPSVGPLPSAPPEPSAETVLAWRNLAEQQQPGQAPRRHSTDELIAAVDKAFAEPADELKPAVVILPFVDGAGQVRSDGVVLGQMAALAAAYTPHRRLALSTPFLHDELALAGCLTTGARLEPGMIAHCTAALETDLYALPRLETGDGALKLTVEFHGDGKTYPDRTFHHEVPADGLRTVPGLAARDVLEALGVGLGQAEEQAVLEPCARNDGELADLIRVLQIYPAGPGEDGWLGIFLLANPHCAVGWDYYLLNAHERQPDDVLKGFAAAEAPCDRLLVAAARVRRESGHAEDALLGLLPLAASQRGETYYHATMARCAIALHDRRLADHLFEVWQKYDQSYAGCLMRGADLIDWAWDARGSGWADTVTEEGAKLFNERLGRARDELERAVDRDPSGYRAHVKLITVARGLGLPRAFMENHFQQAVRDEPHLLDAYNEKWTYLQPRWHGDAEQLLAFGKECLGTGDWDHGIPPLAVEAVHDVAAELPDDVLSRATESGPLWDLLSDYEEGAEKHAGPGDLEAARSVFARLGAIGGHFDEAARAFQELEGEESINTKIFVDQGEYDYFCDLVHARTGKLPARKAKVKRDQALCRASVALASGDLDGAEKDLAGYERGDAANDRLADCYRSAVALGRKLKADGKVALSPQQLKDVCVPVNEEQWTVEGDKLTGRRLQGEVSLVLPLGLRDATISGTTSWQGNIFFMDAQVHARSLRHKEHLRFYPDQKVNLMRDQRMLTQAPYRPGPQRFRIELGADEDRLEPAPGIGWRVPGTDDSPGGFMLTLWAGAGDVTWSISDVRIELNQ